MKNYPHGNDGVKGDMPIQNTKKDLYSLFSGQTVEQESQEIHKIKRAHAKMQRGETEQKRREQVNAKNIQLLSTVYSFLESEFKDTREIIGKEGPKGSKEFSVDFTGKKNYYPEMQIDISADNKIDMTVYPDWHYDADFYVAKDITLEELIDKVKQTKELLESRTFKESGLFTRESHKIKIEDFMNKSKLRIGYPSLF